TDVGANDFVSAGAASGATVVSVESLSFAAFKSSIESTVAVALITLPAITDGATASSIVAVRNAAGAMLPGTGQTTGAPEQLPPPDTLPEIRFVSAGNGSVIVTPVAGAGPLFVTVAMYVIDSPALTGSGESESDIDRSA